MQKDVTKRYVPIHGIGTFICANCVVESSKNFILDEFPEVIGIETHKDASDDYIIIEHALKCLILMAKKFPPNSNMMFLNAETLLNNPSPGTIFIGSNFENMSPDETKMDFIEKVRKDILSLNLMKEKDDSDMDDNEKDHYQEMFEMGEILDNCVMFSEKEDEDDIDDIDIGYEEGINDGIDKQYYIVQVALYKMFKKKKIKDLEFMIEEIHNTIAGMMDGDDFKVWEKNYKKWSMNSKKKESHLEDDKKIVKKEIK